jgi:hypothetical protein
VQGVPALNRVDDVLLVKSLLPLWAINTPEWACPRSQLGDSAGFHLQDGSRSLCHWDRNWDRGCAFCYYL